MGKGDNVKVVCRFRPFNKLEKKKKSKRTIDVSNKNTKIEINSGRGKNKFNFDYIFEEQSSQEEVFNVVGKPIVELVFQGYNGTIFVYGQTGAGKTYTMMGPNVQGSGYCDHPVTKGLIPRIVEDIFNTVQNSDSSVVFTIEIQYIEIYMERLRDLLNGGNRNLKIREDKTGSRGVFVEGAASAYCGSVQEVFEYMKRGASIRVVASHTMNAESSRSHSVFIIQLVQKNTLNGEQKSGKLFLVDLAGSEKVKKTGAQGLLLDQAKHINKSLSALGNVINALTNPRIKFIPYRDSKLTRLLTQSLGGNSKTFLVINCSPSSYNADETLSTLRFGERAKAIKNRAKVNRELDAKELRRLLNQAKETIKKQRVYIKALEQQLKAGGGTITPLITGDGHEEAEAEPNQGLIAIQKKNEEYEKELKDNRERLENVEEERERLKDELMDVSDKLQSQLDLCRQIEDELKAKKNIAMKNEVLENELQSVQTKLQKSEYEKNEHLLTIENLKQSLEDSKKSSGKRGFPSPGDSVADAFMEKYKTPAPELPSLDDIFAERPSRSLPEPVGGKLSTSVPNQAPSRFGELIADKGEGENIMTKNKPIMPVPSMPEEVGGVPEEKNTKTDGMERQVLFERKSKRRRRRKRKKSIAGEARIDKFSNLMKPVRGGGTTPEKGSQRQLSLKDEDELKKELEKRRKKEEEEFKQIREKKMKELEEEEKKRKEKLLEDEKKMNEKMLEEENKKKKKIMQQIKFLAIERKKLLESQKKMRVEKIKVEMEKKKLENERLRIEDEERKRKEEEEERKRRLEEEEANLAEEESTKEEEDVASSEPPEEKEREEEPVVPTVPEEDFLKLQMEYELLVKEKEEAPPSIPKSEYLFVKDEMENLRQEYETYKLQSEEKIETMVREKEEPKIPTVPEEEFVTLKEEYDTFKKDQEETIVREKERIAVESKKKIDKVKKDFVRKAKKIEFEKKELRQETMDSSLRMGRMKEKFTTYVENSKKIHEHLERQKFALMRDLRNRCDKVVDLEMKLDEMGDKYQHALYLARKKDSSKKILKLEKDLKSLTFSHQKYQSANQTLESKIQMLEGKLKIRNERIKNLERSLEEFIEKNEQQTKKHIKNRENLIKLNEKSEREIERLKTLIEQLQVSPMMMGTNVMKPLRGGGGTIEGGGGGMRIVGGGGMGIRGGGGGMGIRGGRLSDEEDEGEEESGSTTSSNGGVSQDMKDDVNRNIINRDIISQNRKKIEGSGAVAHMHILRSRIGATRSGTDPNMLRRQDSIGFFNSPSTPPSGMAKNPSFGKSSAPMTAPIKKVTSGLFNKVMMSRDGSNSSPSSLVSRRGKKKGGNKPSLSRKSSKAKSRKEKRRDRIKKKRENKRVYSLSDFVFDQDGNVDRSGFKGTKSWKFDINSLGKKK